MPGSTPPPRRRFGSGTGHLFGKTRVVTSLVALPGLRSGDRLPGSQLFLRGCVGAAAGTAVPYLLFPDLTGLGSVALTALGLVGTIQFLFERNRTDIVHRREAARSANARLAGGVLLVLLGMLVTYLAVAFALPLATLASWFGPQLGRLRELRDGFEGFEAGPWRDLVRNNAGVMAVFFLLAALYRSGGFLLVLAWNASVWGASLAWLVRLGAAEGDWAPHVGAAVVGVFPHLLLEVLGYVLAGASGFVLSRGALRHGLGSPTFLEILRSGLLMLGLAAALVAGGVAWESGLSESLVASFLAG